MHEQDRPGEKSHPLRRPYFANTSVATIATGISPNTMTNTLKMRSNAEDALRRDALRAIYRQLCKGGVLVCNIQRNATSPIGVVSRILNWAYPRSPETP